MDRKMDLYGLDGKVEADRDSWCIGKWTDRQVIDSELLLTHKAPLCKF